MTFAELTDRASLITWIDALLAEANPEHDFTFGAKDYKRLVRWQSRQAAYKVHTIQKRSGGERTIHVPGKRLKSVLSVLNHALQAELTGKHALAACVIGFVPGRSIVDGAREHCHRRFVFNTDLEDFFPSVELHRIKACLTLAPFNLTDSHPTQTTVTLEPDALNPDGAELTVTDHGDNLAFELANLFTVPMTVTRYTADGQAEQVVRPVLPQGAPTSPTVTNIVCRKLDRRLQGLAKRHGLRYTRYADDLTFSSDHDAYAPAGPFRQQLNAIIEDEGFRQNLSKVRLQRDTERQMVTGLVVNDRVNVVPGYVKDIHNLLRVWENKDLEEAQKHYLVLRDRRGRTKLGAAAKPSVASGHEGTLRGKHVANVLAGKIDFLRMVDGGAYRHFDGAEPTTEGEKGQAYVSVSARHDKLNARLKRLIEREFQPEYLFAATSGKVAASKFFEQKKLTNEELAARFADDAYLEGLI